MVLGAGAGSAWADDPPESRFPLFGALTARPEPSLVGYTPSQLDPRQEINQKQLATSSIRADLEALRPAFDGLVLYAYHEACTPRIVAVARDLKFRLVMLAVWDPRSAAELDGVAELARLHEKELALGVLVGNEGLTFKRYEPEDLTIAAGRLRKTLSAHIPISTSEPLGAYAKPGQSSSSEISWLRTIHPVFDRPALAPGEAALGPRRGRAAGGPGRQAGRGEGDRHASCRQGDVLAGGAGEVLVGLSRAGPAGATRGQAAALGLPRHRLRGLRPALEERGVGLDHREVLGPALRRPASLSRVRVMAGLPAAVTACSSVPMVVAVASREGRTQ